MHIEAVPKLFGSRERFRGRQFFHQWGWGAGGGGGFGMIQAHTFTVPFTSIIIFTSAPPQIIRHYILGPLA